MVGFLFFTAPNKQQTNAMFFFSDMLNACKKLGTKFGGQTFAKFLRKKVFI